MPTGTGTYVYCVIASAHRPMRRRRVQRMPGMGPLRVLDAGRGLWLVVADAPLTRFGEQAINEKLADLDWVARAAVAHESVVESFLDARAILPMKLFTILGSDDRALAQVRRDRQRLDRLVKRVANQLEWGVRVTLDRSRAMTGVSQPVRIPGAKAIGAAYLRRKQIQRDAALELAERARETVAVLYDRLAARSRLARRRSARELPVQGGPLLLDAACLVPRSRSTTFRALVAREARSHAPLGYHVTLSGPWPPYTFVQD